MDKFLLHQQVLQRLAEDLLQAERAMRAAHETATHNENIAENKYWSWSWTCPVSTDSLEVLDPLDIFHQVGDGGFAVV